MQKLSLFFSSLLLMGLWACNNEGDGDVTTPLIEDGRGNIKWRKGYDLKDNTKPQNILISLDFNGEPK